MGLLMTDQDTSPLRKVRTKGGEQRKVQLRTLNENGYQLSLLVFDGEKGDEG